MDIISENIFNCEKEIVYLATLLHELLENFQCLVEKDPALKEKLSQSINLENLFYLKDNLEIKIRKIKEKLQ